jgi:DNA-binding transcriptional LysR family regulator
MDLRQLKYFEMVSKLRSFTRAAEKLCIAQPSITVAIKKLEDELGIVLFDRDKKTVTLTNEGEIFLERVDKILNDVNNVILEMNDFKKLKKEIVKVGIPPMIGSYILPKIFKKYKSQETNVDLRISEFGSLDVVDLLEKEEIDIGIIALNNSSEILETHKIGTTEILVCLPPDHPLRDLTAIPFKLLKDEPFILIQGRGTNMRKMVFEECEKNNFKPNVIFYAKLFDTIKNLVANSVGITFLMDTMIRNDPNIVCHSLEEPLYIQISIAWKKGKYLTKAKREFIDFIKDVEFMI